jgi:cytochrome c peroxidase
VNTFPSHATRGFSVVSPLSHRDSTRLPLRTVFAALPLLTGLLSASLDVRTDADIAPDHLFMFAPITPLPKLTSVQAERVDLGRRLFYDTNLSENNGSCCSSPYWDHQPMSMGHYNRLDFRNAPTGYNSGLEFAQFWDGHAKDLPTRAVGPMMNPVEMGMSGPAQVMAHVRSNPADGRLPHDDGAQDAGVVLPSDAPDDVDSGPGGGGGVLPMGEGDAR